MNFNEIKLKIKSKLANFNFSDWILSFLLKKNRIFLLILLLVLFGYWIYLGYAYLYQPGWSEEKKQGYIESRKEENVVFNRNKFNKVIEEIASRKDNFKKSVENIPDVFSLK